MIKFSDVSRIEYGEHTHRMGYNHVNSTERTDRMLVLMSWHASPRKSLCDG